ncbi:MAG: M61 family metallopeptidase [Phenylobacterium sp.]
MNRHRLAIVAAAFAASLAVGVDPGQGQEAPAFDAVFKPVREGGPEVTAIAVTETIHGLLPGKPLTLSAPVIYAGVPGIADRVKDLGVRDDKGAVPLTLSEDAKVPGGFPYYRHWTAGRPTVGPVSVTFRSLVQSPETARGPPFGIRAVAGGVSGAGSGFLVFPEMGTADLRVRWDVSDLAAGSTGIGSWGEGETRWRDTPRSLTQAWIIAGPVSRFPASGSKNGFSAAWLGQAPFDAPAEMDWAARLYAYFGKSYRYLDPPPPYRVFMRFLPSGTGGGTALPRSFMLSALAGPPKPGATAPHGTLAHEMTHQWVGGIAEPDGINSWFSEGLTTYFSALIPKRGGFATLDDWSHEVARIAQSYYAYPARNWSAAKIAEAGFGDENIRHIPYSRSALYFADIDAGIRARSGGKRRLEDALQPIFRSREKGVRFDHTAWQAFLTRELGPDEAARWRRVILDGELLTPGDHAFGPCFERKPATYRFEDQTLQGFTFERVAGVPDAQCLAW